jgi:hypothetical protein
MDCRVKKDFNFIKEKCLGAVLMVRQHLTSLPSRYQQNRPKGRIT